MINWELANSNCSLAYLIHLSLHSRAGDIVERHQSGIVARRARVGHIDGELMCEVAILDQSSVSLIRDQRMRVEVVDGAFVVVVSVAPRIPHLDIQSKESRKWKIN